MPCANMTTEVTTRLCLSLVPVFYVVEGIRTKLWLALLINPSELIAPNDMY